MLQLLDEMRQHKLELDETSFNAVMHAIREGSGRWCWSCWMRCSSKGWSSMRPAYEVISYCEKTGEWEKALVIVSLRTQSQPRFYFLVRASYTFIIGWYA